MASNPMQRQKKISFFLGFLTMFLLSTLVIGYLGYMVITMKMEEKEKLDAMKEVYVLTTDVASGTTIDSSVMATKKVLGELVPSNRFTSDNLYDEEGNLRTDLIAKIELKQGTVLTADMVTASSQKTTNDLRKQEYNIATLPSYVKTGDYVDIRIRFASGADYIVIAKKEITISQIAGMDALESFSVNLTEEETLTMSSAMIDAFVAVGSEIYVDIYTDPGMQVAATPTYPVNQKALQAISNDPNIVDDVKRALAARYNQGNRSIIDEEVNSENNREKAEDNITKNIQDHITRQKEFRQQYLEALAGGEY